MVERRSMHEFGNSKHKWRVAFFPLLPPLGSGIRINAPQRFWAQLAEIQVKFQMFITLLNDVGSQNITVRFWKLNLNMNHPVQIFEHPAVIFRGPTKRALSDEKCYATCWYQSVFVCWFKMFSIDFFKMIQNSWTTTLNSNLLSLNSTGSSVTCGRISLFNLKLKILRSS